MTALLALTRGTLPDHQGLGEVTTNSISAGKDRQRSWSDEPADATHSIGTVSFASSARSPSPKWTAALDLASTADVVRRISAMISTSAIDQVYERALLAGAPGGKIAGAGGGGFLVLYCPKAAQPRVRNALSDLQSLEFRFDWGGARIAFAQ